MDNVGEATRAYHAVLILKFIEIKYSRYRETRVNKETAREINFVSSSLLYVYTVIIFHGSLGVHSLRHSAISRFFYCWENDYRAESYYLIVGWLCWR